MNLYVHGLINVNVVHIYNGILLIYKENETMKFAGKMDKTGKYTE